VWATGYQDGLGGSIEDEMTVSGGSVVDVSDGRYGRVVTASADFGFNKANMACSVLGEEVIMTGDLDPSSSLEIVGSRIAGRQYEREISDASTTLGRSLVIVLFMYDRMDTSEDNEFYNAVYSLRRTHPSLRLIIVTRNAPKSVFSRFVLFPDHDVFVLSQFDGELLAEADGRKIGRRIAQIPGQIRYSDCRDPKDPTLGERSSEEVLYLLPDTQRFLEISPVYLSDSDELEVRFDVRFNSARICWSRASPEEQSMGGWDDDEFSAQETCETASATGGGADTIKFKWDSDPCQGESVTRCRSIYFRLEGRDSGGLNCQTNENYPCRTAKAAQVVVSHFGMTCSASILSTSMILLVVVTSFQLIS